MVLPLKKKKKKKPKKRPPGFFLRGVVIILPAVLTLFILMTVLRFAQDYVLTPINSTIYWSLEANTIGWKVLSKRNIHPLDQEYLTTDTLPAELENISFRNGINSQVFGNALTAHRDAKLDDSMLFYDLEELGIDRDLLRKDTAKIVPPWIGILLSIILVLVLGSMASGFVGRRVIASIDRGVQQIPVVRSVYPYAKQLVEFFLTETEFDFDTVVAAPYPNDGIYAIAFVTSEGLKSINKALDGRYVSMFVPTSPMPMTGYTVFINADKLIPLPITVDEALRVTVSAGVLIPPAERVEEIEGALEQLGADLDRKGDSA